MTASPRGTGDRRRRARALLLLTSALAWACGGGGGGGGGGSAGAGAGSGGGIAATFSFVGFEFRIGTQPATATPPVVDLGASPPLLGAPLDVVIIFKFNKPPSGDFASGLPVFTTASEVTPAALAPPGSDRIPAKGTYAVVGNNVEFTPFVPTEALSLVLSAPPNSVPGLLPGSTYTALVEGAPGTKLPSLSAGGFQSKFGTTASVAFYFAGATGIQAPQIISVTPADGASGFYPSPYSNSVLGSSAPIYPSGPDSFLLSVDQQLLPTAENLEGKDWNSDGLNDPTFFLRLRGTKLLVSHRVPAGTPMSASAFDALSGLTEGVAVSSVGADVFLHNGPGSLQGQDISFFGTPTALTVGADPALAFMVFPGVVNDSIAVVDHVVGDPRFAKYGGSTQALAGLKGVVGLTVLQDGRMVAYESTQRRLFQITPVVVRDIPVGVPTLASVTIADGSPAKGFRSDVQPIGTEILDLAQSPSGTLFALAEIGGAVPAIVRLKMIDFSLTGAFAAGEGLPDPGVPPVFPPVRYDSIEFVSETTVLALNRTSDRIDRFDLASGSVGTVVTNVAAFGQPLGGFPGGVSPATALALGNLDLDALVTLESNLAAGSSVRVRPRSPLPPDVEIHLMQRPNLASIGGVTQANAVPAQPLYVLGSSRVASVRTASPISTLSECLIPDPTGRIHDAFVESFDDTLYEDPSPPTLSPLAEWGKKGVAGLTSSKLRASVGASATAELGDFLPAPRPDFDVSKAYNGSQPSKANYAFVFLNTDAQNFPLPKGETPGIVQPVTVVGGAFSFRDFIIPEGVWVTVRGSNPAVITATGRIEISGVLDLVGSDGLSDDTFDTGFIPVPGGAGGPGGGRGGDGHPTVFDPSGPGTIDQYATPATGERGWGPVVLSTGQVVFQQVGGFGGASTLGYDPNENGFPKVANGGNNTEFSRPPGGGGGSFYFHGMYARDGSGSYLVQSNGAFGNLTNCPVNDKINGALYGNEENRCAGNLPNSFLQCVHLLGSTANPTRLLPGGREGVSPFSDGDFSNDFIGATGELAVLIGGQGGGGGGSRVDSLNHGIWSADKLGSPVLPPSPVWYPALWGGGTLFFSPTLYDAKAGAGGGGAGSVMLRSFGDITLTRTGRIDASGGDGGGGEIVQNSNYSGGGGGGSGGAVILQAAGSVRMLADTGHLTPFFIDSDGKLGAAIDVSGGYGKDAVEDPRDTVTTAPPGFTHTRSDGGQGGFGMIQFQVGSGNGMPFIQQGAYPFARQRTIIKYGSWNGMNGLQKEHVFLPANPPIELRYIDILHHRDSASGGVIFKGFIPLVGSDPPIIDTSVAAVGALQRDTPMIDHFGRRVVKDPKPQEMMKTYNGFGADFKEIKTNPPADLPGTLFASTDSIPLSIYTTEPGGLPIYKDAGTQEWDPYQVIDRLPVVSPTKSPPPFGTVSRGTSMWIDFNGLLVRVRDSASGATPPLFDGVHGTFNALMGAVPPGKAGQVVIGAAVPNVPGTTPAHYVANTGAIPFFDPGLCGAGTAPYNDIKVDAPEYSISNAITDNATVSLLFQGAYPVRSGSHVPDVATLTTWTADLRELTGYPLVRFQVVFDVGVDLTNYPFGVDSKRPAVDQVRVRASY